MWELERFAWSSLSTADGADARSVAAAVVALLSAQDEDAAYSAYWRIDNTVVLQGALYGAAPAVAASLVFGLSRCTDAARPRVLELLVQLAGPASDPAAVQDACFGRS